LPASAKPLLTQAALILAGERVAAACPFCGGKGATGIFENLMLLGLAWLGIRGMMRASARKRPSTQPPPPEPADVTEPSRSR
jgi:hypothetical protein